MTFSRVLGFYAHPDDADVGAGGLIAQLTRKGVDVSIVVATLGDAGGFERDTHDQIVEIRRQEQLDGARELGVADVSFLDGYHDGSLAPTEALQRDIVRHIRRVQPELILTMSPEHNWNSVHASHPDHRAIGEATIRAVYPAARNPFAFPELLDEGLEPWTVSEVWFQGHKESNTFVALAPEDVERKLAAIRTHVSQFEDMEGMQEFLRSRLAQTAREAGLALEEAAEAFFCVSTT